MTASRRPPHRLLNRAQRRGVLARGRGRVLDESGVCDSGRHALARHRRDVRLGDRARNRAHELALCVEGPVGPAVVTAGTLMVAANATLCLRTRTAVATMVVGGGTTNAGAWSPSRQTPMMRRNGATSLDQSRHVHELNDRDSTEGP